MSNYVHIISNYNCNCVHGVILSFDASKPPYILLIMSPHNCNYVQIIINFVHITVIVCT